MPVSLPFDGQHMQSINGIDAVSDNPQAEEESRERTWKYLRLLYLDMSTTLVQGAPQCLCVHSSVCWARGAGGWREPVPQG